LENESHTQSIADSIPPIIERDYKTVPKEEELKDYLPIRKKMIPNCASYLSRFLFGRWEIIGGKIFESIELPFESI